MPGTEVVVRPLADGGEGTVEALTLGLGGEREHVVVTGPLGEPVTCAYGILKETKTAVVEMSGSAGITLIPEKKRNPLKTTTYGVGEVICDAIKRDAVILLLGSAEVQLMTAEWECCRLLDMKCLMRREIRSRQERRD